MDVPDIEVTLDDMKDTLEFIRLLQNATLEESGLPSEGIHRIRNPIDQPLRIQDPDVQLAIELYIAVSNASEETYNAIRDALMRRFPEMEVLSLYKVRKAVEEFTGVVGQKEDMCVNTCIGYTGPYAKLDNCPKCDQTRYCPVQLAAGKKVPRQQFTTMLPGPQIQ
ncbi:hypothetical protein BD414DRAFT_413739, partial [Trametes punicea]